MLFHRYDFDRDGYVRREDIRLVLSHIPIEKTIISNIQGEGKFTQEGGGKYYSFFNLLLERSS